MTNRHLPQQDRPTSVASSKILKVAPAAAAAMAVAVTLALAAAVTRKATSLVAQAPAHPQLLGDTCLKSYQPSTWQSTSNISANCKHFGHAKWDEEEKVTSQRSQSHESQDSNSNHKLQVCRLQAHQVYRLLYIFLEFICFFFALCVFTFTLFFRFSVL